MDPYEMTAVGRRPTELLELRNGHGWSPSIWDRLMTHRGFTGLRYTDAYDQALNRLWQDIEDLPEWQQAPLVLSFDTGVIPWQAFDWAVDMLTEFEAKLPEKPERVNHVPAVVELLRSKPEAPLLGVWGTSVSENPFDPWDGEKDAPGTGIPGTAMYALPQHRGLPTSAEVSA